MTIGGGFFANENTMAYVELSQSDRSWSCCVLRSLRILSSILVIAEMYLSSYSLFNSLFARFYLFWTTVCGPPFALLPLPPCVAGDLLRVTPSGLGRGDWLPNSSSGRGPSIRGAGAGQDGARRRSGEGMVLPFLLSFVQGRSLEARGCPRPGPVGECPASRQGP